MPALGPLGPFCFSADESRLNVFPELDGISTNFASLRSQSFSGFPTANDSGFLREVGEHLIAAF